MNFTPRLRIHFGKTEIILNARTNNGKRKRSISFTELNYAGKTCLEACIETTRKPKFAEFLSKYKNDIAAWSIGCKSLGIDSLCETWKQRFGLALKASKKGILADSLKGKNDNTWTDIMSLISEVEPNFAPSIDKNSEDIDALDIDSNDTATNNNSYAHVLHHLAYKKLQGGMLNDDDLETLIESQSCAVSGLRTTLLSIAESILLNSNGTGIDSYEQAVLELSLSGIINFLDSGMVEQYKKKLSAEEWAHIIKEKENMNLDTYQGLLETTSDMFDSILMIGTNIEEILIYIDDQRSQLSKQRKHRSREYLMLMMVEQIVRNFSRWSRNGDDSELTIYRRLAALLDILFDGTAVIMFDGEHACEATKLSIDFNKAVFCPFDKSNTYGRKIDLLLKSGQGMKQCVELAANEWKRGDVRQDLKIYQQSKNLRSNASILQQLLTTCDPHPDHVIVMDFIGNFGYLYMLKHNQLTGCYVSQVLSPLIIPSHIDGLNSFKVTLDYFFKMQSFFKNTTKTLNQALLKQEMEHALPTLSSPLLKPSCHDGLPTPIIFWSPRRNLNAE
ncbi:unnamed protein product [Absidia cylindrospora]